MIQTNHSKVKDLDVLANHLKSLKKKGKKIVHSHGVFDLIHLGHIRHLREAKGMGDVLVVTITPDQYVNKGPHRPAFNQDLRAEVISSLEMVDYVAINRWPEAEETIKLLSPHVYVKGPDYVDAEKDVTGGIKREEESIRSVGGEIKYTQDITFSSSRLVNQHLSLLPQNVKEYLSAFRESFSVDDVTGYIEKLLSLKVLVVGETILDEYIYCEALGKSGKEPVLAMRHTNREISPGGILAIANHLADFCQEVAVITYLGQENTQKDFILKKLKKNVQPTFITKSKSPTIVKRRYVDNYFLTKMFEIYEMNSEPLNSKEEEKFSDILEEKLKEYDIVIVADYGHGLMTKRTIELLSQKAKFLAVNTQINAANIGFHTISKYPRADYICIHEGEIRLEHRNRTGDLEKMVIDLSKKMSCPSIMVTRGNQGVAVYQKGKDFHNCPSFAVKVIDRVGAGDAVLALSSICVVQKVPVDVIGFISNLVGAQAVMIMGNRSSIDRTQLLKGIVSLMK